MKHLGNKGGGDDVATQSDIDLVDRHALGSQAATAAYDYDAGAGGFTLTLTGNASISNPINLPTLAAGQYVNLLLEINQDATGSRVPSWGSMWKNTPTLSTTANAKDVIAGIYDGTDIVLGEPISI